VTEVIDGWTIEGDRAWRVDSGLPGGVIERSADEIRGRNLLWRAAKLSVELEYRRLSPLRPSWHCSARTLDLVAKSIPVEPTGLPIRLYGLPVVVDESTELHIEIALP
jgi:hypothetical protein